MIGSRTTHILFRASRALPAIEQLEDRRLLSTASAWIATHSDSPAFAPATAQQPSVASVVPASGSTGIALNTAVTCDMSLPNGALDPSTVTAANVSLVRTSDGSVIPSVINTTGGGDAIILQPSSTLAANTNYTFRATSGVKDVTGASLIPFTSTFTTGTTGGGTDPNISFQKTKVATPNDPNDGFTCVRIGPDGLLYASSEEGYIYRYPINSDGTLGTPQVISSLRTANGNTNRLISGFAFDPSSTASNVTLWVSNTFYALSLDTNGQDLTGKITVMSGPNLSTVQDAVIHLPRSISDHVTNQPVFGPDGKLYFSQAAENAYGAKDNTWQRDEHMLSSAILRLDTSKVTPGQPVDVLTPDVGGTYDPFNANNPLTIYATGVRNAFEIFFDSRGTLWAPSNGSSAGGNTPAFSSSDPNQVNGRRIDTGQPYAGPDVPALTNVQQTEDDYMFKVVQGGYYGHPNPTRGEYVLDDGNPSSGGTPNEMFSAYPVGTNPDPNYRGANFDLGAHHSPDGIIQYQGNEFNGALNGKLLIAEYSAGDDIAVLSLDSNDNIVGINRTVSGFTGLQNPVNLVEDNATGNIYVSELGAKQLSLLRPVQTNPQGPAAPTNLQANVPSTLQVNLTWDASAGATSYRVERQAAGDSNFVEIASNVTTTSYTDQNVSQGGTYQYRVRAQNAVGLSAYSGIVTANLPNPQVAAPSNLVATPSGSTVALTWDAAAGASTYHLEREGPGDAAFTEIAGSLTTTSFTDSSFPVGGTYLYRVRAQAPAGFSEYSNTATADVVGAGQNSLDVTIGKGANKSVRFVDADGTSAIITMSGNGTAVVHFSSISITESTTKAGVVVSGTGVTADSITITGDASTALTINAHGGTKSISIASITANGALKSITANTTDLTGNLSAGGAVAKASFASLSGATISIPTIGTLKVLHNATFNLNTSSARTLTVGAQMSNSTLTFTGTGLDAANITSKGALNTQINSAGNLGVISLTSMQGSEVYAGVGSLSSGHLLPFTSTDFTSAASIKSLKLRGGRGTPVFVNSAVAVSQIGTVSLGSIQFDNGGIPFGVAAHSIAAFSGIDPTTGTFAVHKITDESQVTAALTAKGINAQDFVVRIL